MNPYKFIGQSLVKPDARDKLTGKAKYVADLDRDGMLYGKIVRSPYAHALIRNIDTSEATKVPGVVGVYTAKDIIGTNKVSMSGPKDQPVLAEGKVRFLGEAVAVVVAETEEIAEAAVEKVAVKYEPLSVINGIEDAKNGDILVHENGNKSFYKKVVKGDFEKALAEAHVVVTRVYKTPFVEHAYIEPDACMANWEEDHLVVSTSTKSAHLDQGEIARVLDFPKEKIQVQAATIGGSFGGKSDVCLVCITALAAFLTKKPVKIVYTREECMQVTTKRHPYLMRYTHAATADGKLIGVKAEILAETGPYQGYTPATLTRAVVHGSGPYNVPNVKLEATGYYTNNPITGAMRGFGVPQVAFAHELQMDLLADALNMNPIEFRLKNVFREGDTMVTGTLVGNIGLEDVLCQVRDRIKKETKPQEFWGVACAYYGNGRTGFSNPGVAVLELDPNGNLVVKIGSPDIGQGSCTVMRQIAAEVTGIQPEKMNVITADTFATEDSGTTSATRVTYIVGRAVEKAAHLLIQRIGTLVQAKTGRPVDLDSLIVSDSNVIGYTADKQNLQISLSSILEDTIITTREVFDPIFVALDENGQGEPYGVYTYCVHAARVKVDAETGATQLKKVIAGYDTGKVINPILIEGQAEGGTVGGIGYGLFEEVIVANGEVKNRNFGTYILPTSMDCCEIETIFVDRPEGDGPFGAKGIGEPALLTAAPAIVNAVNKATGLQLNKIPITAEYVWQNLNLKGLV